MSRRGRYVRNADPRPMRRSERDDAIIKVVGDHRFIETPDIQTLLALGGFSRERTRHRLGTLFDHGLLYKLDLPRRKWVNGGGSHPDIYALTDEGAELYTLLTGMQPRGRLHRREKSEVKRTENVEHQLLTTRVLVAFECACAASEGARFVRQREIVLPEATRAERQPFRWYVSVREQGREERLSVEPDALFGIGDARGRRAWYFLEAERATMDIEPRAGGYARKSSMTGKFRAYRYSIEQGIPTRRFGFPRARVLTVTSRTMLRLANLQRAALKAAGEAYAPHFLFATEQAVVTGDVLRAIWCDAHDDPATLFRGSTSDADRDAQREDVPLVR